MAGKPRPKKFFEEQLAIIQGCIDDTGSFHKGIQAASVALGKTEYGVRNILKSAELFWQLTITLPEPQEKPRARAAALFTVDPLPHDGEPDAKELIRQLKTRNETRRLHAKASELQNVRVNVDGPIGLAFFGDPHVDNPGCDWIDLERDVNICKNTEGLFAINLGDSRDNWVGRLMALYANHEVTAKQALVLIEWLFTSLPWLVTVLGNHDRWGQEHGDVAQVMHRLRDLPGLCEGHGVRLKLHLPAGCDFTVHVRHDFPGGSQFNPAHALVRETLFGYRDHILACGHRHSTGYIPIWHNDPARLCHGFRVGTYKVSDEYAKEKGFKELNWAKSMAAVIDPEYAHDPLRYIKPFFSLEEAAEYLTWRRGKWASQKSVA